MANLKISYNSSQFTTMLSRLSGVTSDIQPQIDSKLASSSYTAYDVLAKLLTIDGPDSGLDADLLDGNHANAFSLVGHTHAGIYEPANSNIQTHISNTSNPHSTTSSQVGLGNVTNNAQIKKISSSTDNQITRWDGTTGDTLQGSLATIDDTGSINIPTGQSYKINNVALSYSDVGAASSGHTHAGVYEPILTKGNLTETTSSVLTITGGTSSVIGSGASIQVKQASHTQSGYLSSTDWDTFNNKQSTLNYGTLTGTTNQVNLSASGTNVLVGGTSITLSLPQSIATTSDVQFQTLVTKKNAVNTGNNDIITIHQNSASTGYYSSLAFRQVDTNVGARIVSGNTGTYSGKLSFQVRTSGVAGDDTTELLKLNGTDVEVVSGVQLLLSNLTASKVLTLDANKRVVTSYTYQDIATTATPQFARIGLGIAASSNSNEKIYMGTSTEANRVFWGSPASISIEGQYSTGALMLSKLARSDTSTSNILASSTASQYREGIIIGNYSSDYGIHFWTTDASSRNDGDVITPTVRMSIRETGINLPQHTASKVLTLDGSRNIVSTYALNQNLNTTSAVQFADINVTKSSANSTPTFEVSDNIYGVTQYIKVGNGTSSGRYAQTSYVLNETSPTEFRIGFNGSTAFAFKDIVNNKVAFSIAPSTCAVNLSQLTASTNLILDSNKDIVSLTPASKINDPSGGLTIDAEARVAINAIIDAIEAAKLSATS